MKIGVLDTDGEFSNSFFQDKKIKIMRNQSREKVSRMGNLTHAEYVCSQIFKENSDVEIVLVPVISDNMKCSVKSMIEGIEMLVKLKVDMINLSIGDEYRFHQELENSCKKAYDSGILIIAAHSNNNFVEATYPASFPFVLGVRCIQNERQKEILIYDEERNDIIFSSSYFSIYHLGIPKLIQGNSFGCAKMAGLLSHYKTKYQEFLKKFQKSKLNIYYPYESLKMKRCFFLSNRLNEELEQRFMKEITNTVISERFHKEILKKLKNERNDEDKYDTVLVDHDKYIEILVFKDLIVQCVGCDPQKEWVLRYPLFSLFERLTLYQKRIIIHQFFV